MTNESSKLIERINFCARTLKAFGAGKLIVNANYPTLRYEVNNMGMVRVYRTLDDLETFIEHLIEKRSRPSYNTRYTKSRRMASYVL